MTVDRVVRECFSDKGDVDEDVLAYVISCLEDETFDFSAGGSEIFDTVGLMLVSAGCCDDDDDAMQRCTELASRLASGGPAKKISHIQKLAGGPKSMGHDDDSVPKLVAKASAKDMIQTRFDDRADLSVMTDKDAVKAAKRAGRDERRARVAAEAVAAQAQQYRSSTAVVRRGGEGGAVKDVYLEQINVSNGGKELIADCEVMLAYGRRYGIVGRNGAGKSTFLRALAGGEIKGLPPNAQVLHVEQEVAGDDTPVLQAVLNCDVERSELLGEEARLLAELNEADASTSGSEAVNAQLQRVYTRLQDIDADGAVARAARILSGLSFDETMQARATRTFSGGWRMRVALARALFVAPDLLLLDEPTNHLDLHAVLWLEDYLLSWGKTVLLVSHARDFLNAVCTDILHLTAQKLTPYRGTYDNFVKTLNERLRNQAKQAEALDAKRRHMQAFVDKFRYNAKRASLVQSRIKAIERLGEVPVLERDPEYVFNFPFPDAALSQGIVSFDDVSFHYASGPYLFRRLSFGIDLETRAAIVGPNGIGKSTLLGLISGALEATSGVITRNHSVRMATYSQHHMDGLDLHLTPLGHFRATFAGEKEEALRSHLGRFGVSADLALQPMYTLSGGQKSRVAFAKALRQRHGDVQITYYKPHLLLLDEPSNHLDMEAVDALIEGINAYKGGVLMVSHDQWLIESTMHELWMCESGAIDVFHGSFEDYKSRLRDHQQAKR